MVRWPLARPCASCKAQETGRAGGRLIPLMRGLERRRPMMGWLHLKPNDRGWCAPNHMSCGSFFDLPVYSFGKFHEGLAAEMGKGFEVPAPARLHAAHGKDTVFVRAKAIKVMPQPVGAMTDWRGRLMHPKIGRPNASTPRKLLILQKTQK